MTKERAIELLKNFNQYDEPNCMGYWDCDECVEALYMGIEAIQQMPKRGKWIEMIDCDPITGEPYPCGVQCSDCGETLGCVANFCPNCGARMETEQ